MAKQIMLNNTSIVITEFVTPSMTTISVNNSEGDVPPLTNGDWYIATIIASGAEGPPEIVKVTAITATTATIVRAQENTPAGNYIYGATLQFRITAGTLNNYVQQNELVDPDGSSHIGFIQAGTGAIARTAQDKMREFVSVQDFGAVGDGVTDAGAALATTLAAHGTINFPKTASGYHFEASRTITLTRDTVIDFEENDITFGNTTRITFVSPVGVSGRTITEVVQRGSAAVKLNSLADIEVGDLLYIETTIAPSSEWADTKKDCVRVQGFSGAYVILEESLNFGYDPSDAGLQVMTYKPKRLTIKSPHLIMSSDASPRVLFEIRGCQDVVLDKPYITGSLPFNFVTNIFRVGIVLYRCFGAVVENPVLTNMSYPIELDGGTRNVRANNVIANGCRHTIEAADWSSNLTVDGLDASACYSAVSAHPSFNVFFRNFSCRREVGLANVRTINGGIYNGTIETFSTDTDELPQFQSIIMQPAYTYVYADADFDAHFVKWIAPNRLVRPCFAVNYGRNVRVSNLTMPVMGMSLTSRGNISNLEIGNRMIIGGLPSPTKAWMQNTTRIVRPPLVPPQTLSGQQVVHLPNQLVDSVGNFVDVSGPLAVGVSNATPYTASFIFYLDSFPGANVTDEVVGYLTLNGSVRHNASGRFSTKSKTWNFISSRSSPGTNSLFPLTPVWQSTASGQTNENLTLDITGTVFGTDSSGYQFVQVNVSMTATGLASLFFGLSYNLKLHRLF